MRLSTRTARLTRRALGAVAALTFAGCGDEPTGPDTDKPPVTTTTPVAAVVISVPSAVVGQGATRSLSATTHDSTGATLTGRTITWSSSNTSAVTVSSAGVVSGLTIGSATITATSEGKTAVAAIVVMPPVSTITVTGASLSLIAHSEQALAATLRDAQGTTLMGRPITWSSSSDAVATVDGDGTVTSVAPGSATITATSEGKTGTFTLTVTADEILPGSIVGGRYQSCALTTAGKAYCWGIGAALGAGPGLLTRTVLPVLGNLTFKSLHAGGERTIGLTTTGEVYSWGQDFNGSLGQGPLVWPATNQFEPGKVTLPGVIKAVAASGSHALALTTTGAVYGWGWNLHGEAGQPQGVQVVSTPTLVAGLPVMEKIAAAGYGSYAITSTGVAYGWGEVYMNGGATPARRYSPVLVAGNIAFSQIASGAGPAFGIATDGKVYAWGDAAYPSPKAIGGNLTFTQIVAGGAAALGLTAAGDVYEFGVGAIPVGGTVPTPPVLVPGGRKFVAIGGAGGTVLGFTADGSVYAWGVGDGNQRGDGVSSGEIATTPVAQEAPGFTMTGVSAPSIAQGSTKTISIPITATNGGFTRAGIRKFKGTVTLTATDVAPGLTVSFAPAAWTPGSGASITATVTVSSSAALGVASFTIAGTSPGATSKTAYVGFTVTAPPPPASVGNYSCTNGELSSVNPGYQCVTYGGKTTLVKFAVPELIGTWVDQSAGVCFNWKEDGSTIVTFQGGGLLGGAARAVTGKWGAMATTTGGFYPNPMQWYIYTSAADDQTKLLGYDSGSKSIVGWSFSKGSCPW